MLEMGTYRTRVALEPAVELNGFKVEATDGSIGKVDESTADAGKSTSSWTPGRGSSVGRSSFRPQTIERIDLEDRVVLVDRTQGRDQERT